MQTFIGGRFYSSRRTTGGDAWRIDQRIENGLGRDRFVRYFPLAVHIYCNPLLSIPVSMVTNPKVIWRLMRRRRVGAAALAALQADLLGESSIDSSYLILIIGSCVIASLGLLSNSAAVIIGAMLVAPLMLPIRGMAFGALEGNFILFTTGLTALLIGTGLAIAISCTIGWTAGLSYFGSEVWARSRPNLLDLGIAVAAGSISGYAKVEPKVSNSLAGTAIAVALMPPVCVIGLGLSAQEWQLSQGAALLYLTNLLGISLSCMITFWLKGYAPLAKAQRALRFALLLTAALLVPLSISFIELVRQSRLEYSVRRVLLRKTVTFQRVELVEDSTNWLTDPPEIVLAVRSSDPVTPEQVRQIENLIIREMGRPFRVVFEVSRVEEVTKEGLEGPNNPDVK